MKNFILYIIGTTITLISACNSVTTSDNLKPLNYHFDSTEYERNIIVISDQIDTASINSDIASENLSYAVRYSVYNAGEFCKLIKFSDSIPTYLYVSIMAVCSDKPKTRDCYIVDIHKKDKAKSYVLRYSNPSFRINKKEYYYGRFFDETPFIIDVLALVDTSINNCSYKFDSIPFKEKCNSFLNKDYFKLTYLESVKEQKPSMTITINN